MKSLTTKSFRQQLAQANPAIRKAARKQYYLWRDNPRHPSLHFKEIAQQSAVTYYSVRITQDYRALGAYTLHDDTILWFWVGSHAEYDTLLKRL